MSYLLHKRERYRVSGQVQDVGFRPFIYAIAHELKLTGFVKNSCEGVEIEVQGISEMLTLFNDYLFSKLPPLARIDTIEKSKCDPTDDSSFEILQSSSTSALKTALVSPDIATCKACLDDILHVSRYRGYFATNCTNCGPRYSIIKTVPYDRVHTSMNIFTMCNSCSSEYRDPLNRRYHAQPISCNICGPTLLATLEEVATAIKQGKIVAIKGIGGFHLVCDATNDIVIKRLRGFKNRPTKPFAIMCKDVEQVKKLSLLNEKEQELLESKEAPIVILKKLNTCKQSISELIAPNIDKVGCFLPYTPLHHLLFKQLQNPIVATSANLSDEPIIIDAKEIKERLPFVEFVLDFNRDIINAIDDSLMQVIDGKAQTLRLSRGYAPKIIKLPFKSKNRILAVGANAKNSIAFVIDDSIIISPYIGDLDSLKAFDFFLRTLESFQRFYDFEPDIIVHDKHPSYHTTVWAEQQNAPCIAVQHHLAHIYACKAEFGLSGEYLGFSFDGTGYGDDKTLWGAEVFVGQKRKYTFKPIKLLGGEKAIKEPRRVALSMLFERYSLEEIIKFDLELVKSFKESELKLLYQSYTKNLNAPLSSSIGRLFDAVASFAGLLHLQTYEGEAGLMCEEYYDLHVKEHFSYSITDGVITVEFDVFDKNIVSKFMNTLVDIVVHISKEEAIDVILSGGVFQNKTLLELIVKALKKEKIRYYFQQETCINDGGIALGQIYYALSTTINQNSKNN
ncbi:MAG: carbamoyltransferase HypF [Campylobacterota bacterium]|nr:carbamoyltransferase HypF [Campylobacterota bacterium]